MRQRPPLNQWIAYYIQHFRSDIPPHPADIVRITCDGDIRVTVDDETRVIAK